MKKRDALLESEDVGCVGWTVVFLASGKDWGTDVCSFVGGPEQAGSRRICFIVENGVDLVSLERANFGVNSRV